MANLLERDRDLYIPEVRRNPWVHTFFWITFYLYLVWDAGYSFDQLFTSLIDSLIYLASTLLTVYFNISFLLPRYLYRKQYVQYSILLVLIVFVGALIKSISYIYIIPSTDIQEYSILTILSAWFFKSLFETIAISSFQIIQDWANSQKYYKELDNQRLQTELKFLKTQMQPHFLFNTLNNIFFLIKRNPDKAEESVIKLSELLRYRLYVAADEKVNINDEINYTKNYLDLQRVRYGDEIIITFSENGKCDMMVEPFIFMDFVENCFKHARPSNFGDVYIDIRFELKPNSILFYAVNSVNEEEIQQKLKTGGIGINNIIKRLNILYPGQHHLIIEELLGKFKVQLEITQ
jgi:LytS/YehU family sensor histidine kinase